MDNRDFSNERRELLRHFLEGAGIEMLEKITPGDKPNGAPLSFAQQRLWFLDQLKPGDPFYNTFLPLSVDGVLDIPALEASFGEVIRRHEILRTTFASANGQPVQVTTPAKREVLPLIDLMGLPESDREPLVRKLAAAESQRSFDLARGPLIRILLMRLDDTQHVLLLAMHHIVSDGWSMGVLIRETVALYESFISGAQSPLLELQIQYSDFSYWQRNWLSGEVLDAQLDYWKRQLDGAPTLLELPSDRPRPPVQTLKGASYTFGLPEELSAAVRSLSRQEGVTLFMVLLAAFEILLYRYTGRKDIVVGSAIANRNRAEIEPLIGFFVNTLVLRTDLSGDPNFRELLGRVRQVTLEAFNHQDLPFERLVEALQPKRSFSYFPVYQVEFTIQNAPVKALKAPRVTLGLLNVESETVETDFSLIVWDTAQGLVGNVSYSTDLFDASTISRMMKHYENMLGGMLANPDASIAELPLLSSRELYQAIHLWNDTSFAFPRHLCIHDLFFHQVRSSPDAIAVVHRDDSLSYFQLDCRANQLAHHLRSLGIGPESIVAILLPRGLDLAVAILGVLKSGAAYLPIDHSYPDLRIKLMLEDAEAAALITIAGMGSRLTGSAVRQLCLDEQSEVLSGSSTQCPATITSSDNLAYVICTSGTTGKPSAVMISHRAVVSYALAMKEQMRLRRSDRVMQFASIGFDVMVEEIIPGWLSGAAVVMRESQEVASYEEISREIERQQITVIEMPTAYWQGWVKQMREGEEGRLSSIREMLVGGERLAGEVVKKWEKVGKRVMNVYGVTEATVTSTVGEAMEEVEEQEVTIGRAIGNTRMYVMDERMEVVAVGVRGEIYIGGESVGRGYKGEEGKTAERYVPDDKGEEGGGRMYRTGDEGRYREDGRIEYIGRRDEQVKVRGMRVELGEIESFLNQHPLIQESAVVVEDMDEVQPQLIKRKPDGAVELTQSQVVMDWVSSLGPELSDKLFTEVEGLSDEDVEVILASELQLGESERNRIRRYPEFDIELRFKDDQFINPPQKAQKNWLVRRALDEFADDLRSLDEVSKRFVSGSARRRLAAQLEWNKSPAHYDNSQLIIFGQQVMQDWERPLMRAMAEVVTETHGDILELGFGMGISATYIQEFGARSYTVVEYNDEVVKHFNDWKKQYPGRNINLMHGKWHDVIDQLGMYDGVFFDTVPTDEEEYVREVIDNVVMAEDFFPVAASHLRKGGIFTWYTNEIDSLSRRHQRLIFKYFSSFSVSIVRPLYPPEDCHYWFADSMAVVKAIK